MAAAWARGVQAGTPGKFSASYLKVCAMLVPKEMKIEHQGRIAELSDEQLDACIATLEEIIARKAGEQATVIEGEAEVVPTLPMPKPTKA